MEVWQEIAEDQERGARRLVAECGDRLYNAAFLLCRDESAAEDLVFRTLTLAVRRIGQYGKKSSFYNWLYSIMLNLYRSARRKMKAQTFPTGEIPDDAPCAWAENGDGIAPDEASMIRRAVRLLPPIFREVVVLRYFEDKSLLEIRDLLSVPLSTVKSRLRLAQAKLNVLLGDIFVESKRRLT